MADFLHERRDFNQLLAVVADERGLDPVLVEKDYWIMHCLWGLQDQGFQFELKGGTKFDSSRDRGEIFAFPLGGGRVIRGWDLGVAGMYPGEKRVLIVPPGLGYGSRSAGPIPGNSTIIFIVEYLGK